MKRFFKNLRDVAIAGFLFLVPVYILLIVVTKAWTSLTTLGTRLATFLGLKSVMGVGGSTIASSLLLIAIWMVCGLLVRHSFVAGLNRKLDGWLSSTIPGYATYKSMIESKVQPKTVVLPYASALLRQGDTWLPAYVVEENAEGSCVLFLPDAPDPTRGSVRIVQRDQLRFLPTMSANQLEASLKKKGEGLLQ